MQNYTALGLVLVATGASAFDTASYCSQVAASIGGSYRIEEACRQQEGIAASKLATMQIPDRVETYCRGVAESIGGSYRIMSACIEREIAARDRMGQSAGPSSPPPATPARRIERPPTRPMAIAPREDWVQRYPKVAPSPNATDAPPINLDGFFKQYERPDSSGPSAAGQPAPPRGTVRHTGASSLSSNDRMVPTPAAPDAYPYPRRYWVDNPPAKGSK